MFILTLAALLVLLPGSDNCPLKIYADLNHTGKQDGPIERNKLTPSSFVIVTPLPAKAADQKLLSHDDAVVNHLGRLRLEAPKDSRISIHPQAVDPSVLRLFQKTIAGWQRIPLHPNVPGLLSVEQTGTLEIGVSVVLPVAKAGEPEPVWPSRFILEIGVQNDMSLGIPFRVAPFLIPSSLDPVEELLVVSQPTTAKAVKGLEEFATMSKVKLVAHPARKPSDQWMQDTIEPGLFTMPLLGKRLQVRAALTGVRAGFRTSSAALDKEMTDWFLNEGIVAITAGTSRQKTRWIDWYGNLEVTPAHTDREGKRFSYGRVLTGQQNKLAMHPGIMKFLEAQRLQWPPIVVDTSWLLIGHVDEVVNFVPAKTKSGFKVLLPSPQAGRWLLDAMLTKGLGDTPLFQKTREATTVKKLSDQFAASKENLAIDEKIKSIRLQLQQELNLEETDFVMIPTLFDRGVAIIPNAVNSIVVNSFLVAPEPRGPIHQGKDLFQEALCEALKGCEVKVVFIDGWQAYHTFGGEVHCGTNTFRRLRQPAWWENGR